VAFFFVADFLAELFFEWGEEVEGDVGGLEFFVVGVGDVVGEEPLAEMRGAGRGVRPWADLQKELTRPKQDVNLVAWRTQNERLAYQGRADQYAD